MLISIITASFNSEKTIKDTIESVLNQTYTNIEYILIDGNSTDKTVEIIKSYEQKFKEKGIYYKWISEPDKGIYDAFNKGINLSNGKWISFLGSDDCYLSDAIETYNTMIFNTTDTVDLFYSDVKIVKGNKEMKTINGVWSWAVFKRLMNIAHVGAFHNKEYFKKYGLFDTSYKIAGDYELLLRAKERLKTVKIDKITALMGYGGVSNSDIKKVYNETTRAKVETAKLSKIICKLDHFKWTLKNKIKKVVNAFIR